MFFTVHFCHATLIYSCCECVIWCHWSVTCDILCYSLGTCHFLCYLEFFLSPVLFCVISVSFYLVLCYCLIFSFPLFYSVIVIVFSCATMRYSLLLSSPLLFSVISLFFVRWPHSSSAKFRRFFSLHLENFKVREIRK